MSPTNHKCSSLGQIWCQNTPKNKDNHSPDSQKTFTLRPWSNHRHPAVALWIILQKLLGQLMIVLYLLPIHKSFIFKNLTWAQKYAATTIYLGRNVPVYITICHNRRIAREKCMLEEWKQLKQNAWQSEHSNLSAIFISISHHCWNNMNNNVWNNVLWGQFTQYISITLFWAWSYSIWTKQCELAKLVQSCWTNFRMFGTRGFMVHQLSHVQMTLRTSIWSRTIQNVSSPSSKDHVCSIGHMFFF